jgi:hypothetical protein
MSLEGALQTLNRMVRDRVVAGYAVGGGMGVLFYTEPFQTDDLDIFVAFPQPEPAILSLEPVFSYLRSKGCRVDGQYVIVDGLPVQILPISDELVEEAVDRAVLKKVGAQSVRVLRPEHLLAIMASLARPKDRVRIPLLLDQGGIDKRRLRGILSRHGLLAKWDRIVR